MTTWRTEVRRDRAVFDEVASWWDAQPAVTTSPLLHSRVLGCWEDGFDEPGSRRRVHLLLRDGEPVAGLAVYAVGGRLRSMGRTVAGSLDVVVAADDEVVAYLPRWLSSFPLLGLYRVREDSPVVAHLPSKRRWEVHKAWESPYLDVSAGADAMRAARGSGFRRGLARGRRGLASLGEVEFVDVPVGSAADPLVQAGLALEREGWKGVEGVAVLSNEATTAWYRNLADAVADLGWLRASGLSVGERLVAFSLDAVVGDVRYGLITAYDETPEVARCSPGRILHDEVLAAAAADGVARFEFGYGEDRWKFDWTSTSRRVLDLRLHGDGPLGRALHARSGFLARRQGT